MKAPARSAQLLLLLSLLSPLVVVVTAMSTPLSKGHTRSMLPSRPAPISTTTPPNQQLDAKTLIGTTRIGQTTISPDGRRAIFEVRQYDFSHKKFDNQLWLISDLSALSALSEESLKNHEHLQQLTSGREHGWTTANAPNFSPCGGYVAFLSNRPTGNKGGGDTKTSVWIVPVDGPGEAKLLREFPISVGDLDWSHGTGSSDSGITVSASVYVDQDTKRKPEDTTEPMKRTADRDEELADDEKQGGLNAVLYKRLPIREWDRWLDSKMAHPFYFPVTKNAAGQYTCPTTTTANNTINSNDLLSGVPTAVPSGAFGGSEDWSISSLGHVAFSARPPLAEDEAWTTNRHIYLTESKTTKLDQSPPSSCDDDDTTNEHLLGKCLTTLNLGFDTNPTFSPDGQRLAWLTMAGPSYESDAVGIQVYDIPSGKTTTLLKAEVDWAHSPNSLTWSKDGTKLYFGADVRSRMVVAYIDSTVGVQDGDGITILGDQRGCTSLHGEYEGGLLTTMQSLTMPSEIFTLSQDGTSKRQITHFNTDTVAQMSLGRSGELIYKGEKDEDVQAWLLRPAGFSEEDETESQGAGKEGTKKRYPLAVIYHGGPQGSTMDDWHYRWNLQYYASRGFAVLAPNFHGSTGFGHQFCRDISENWEIGGLDTIAGVRAAIAAHPWIDESRVVGLGASYGGYTSNWLNGNAPVGMFKALVCHCGTFDLRSSYFATEELFFMETEFGGPAYTSKSRSAESDYQKYTPSKKIHEWQTPTLVIHGAKDYRLVESEGISTFTALQRQNVPSEMLYLPSENHHCLNPQNSMVWHETVLGWIQRWTTTSTKEEGNE